VKKDNSKYINNTGKSLVDAFIKTGMIHNLYTELFIETPVIKEWNSNYIFGDLKGAKRITIHLSKKDIIDFNDNN
jgi:hypothetical protein